MSIVNPANEWTVDHHELFLHSRRKYRFSPDTVLINGNYHLELTYDDSFLGQKATGRYYREENGIVYTSDGAVVYNLNLGAGDTLPSFHPNQGTRTVVSVGTVSLNDNISRKTMAVRCATDSFDTVTVVEGMGDLEDFFRSAVQCINPLDGPSDLILCFTVNGEIVFLKPGETCDLSSTTNPAGRVVAVYPNPVFDRLYIDLPDEASHQTYRVRIYNALGKCLLSQNTPVVNGLLSVGVPDLNGGRFWGVLHNDDGKIYNFTFLITKD